MATRKGTPREIATQGFSSNEGLGVATQGFIEPVLGDLILGGAAGVVFETAQGGLTTGGAAIVARGYLVNTDGGLILGGVGNVEFTQRYFATGGLIFGGTALVNTSVAPVVGGNMSTGGNANVTVCWNVFGTGGINTGGDANENRAWEFASTGGLAVDGDGNVIISIEGDNGGVIGGIVIGGAAIVDSNVGPREFGRGGAAPRRRPQFTFDPVIWKPEDYYEPMDFLDKIKDKIKEREPKEWEYLARGTLRIKGKGKVTAILHDLPNGEMVIANNAPLEPILLDLPNVFNKGASAREIAELEDHLFLNDAINKGHFIVRKGLKARYVPQKKSTTGGQASVSFVSGKSKVAHFSMADHIRRKEDDELVLGLNTEQEAHNREEEELRILGIID